MTTRYISFLPYTIWVWLMILWAVYEMFTGNYVLWNMTCADINFLCWIIIFAREYRDG